MLFICLDVGFVCCNGKECSNISFAQVGKAIFVFPSGFPEKLNSAGLSLIRGCTCRNLLIKEGECFRQILNVGVHGNSCDRLWGLIHKELYSANMEISVSQN